VCLGHRAIEDDRKPVALPRFFVSDRLDQVGVVRRAGIRRERDGELKPDGQARQYRCRNDFHLVRFYSSDCCPAKQIS
jgi:hypothetical protein